MSHRLLILSFILSFQQSTTAFLCVHHKLAIGSYTRALQQPLYSSIVDDDDEDGEGDDALSKLIGKRDSIRKRRDVIGKPTTSSDNVPIDDLPAEKLEEILGGKTGMEVFEMPDFKTKRPLVKRLDDETKDKSRGGPGSTQEKGDEDKFIDFQAEYDDENDFHIPNRVGFGTAAWGEPDRGFKAGKKMKKKESKSGMFLAGDLQLAYNKLMESGVTFVDTSENYGLVSRKDNLSAEHIIGQCTEENSERAPLIASTLSNPWTSLKQGTGLRFGTGSILSAISKSAERMGASAIDLYQVPAKMFYLGTPGCVVNALAVAMDQGLINNVGVCNMDKSAMKSFIRKLSKKGYTLTSNQFEFSLVNRKALKSGLIKACKDLGVIPIAHTPLGRGLATGIYTATNPTGGQVSGKQPFPFDTLEKYSTLHTMVATVQKKVRIRLEKENRDLQDRRGRYRGGSINSDVTTAQIAINYVVAKGCVPVPGINTPKEAEELLGCLGWALTDDEVDMLDKAADLE